MLAEVCGCSPLVRGMRSQGQVENDEPALAQSMVDVEARAGQKVASPQDVVPDRRAL